MALGSISSGILIGPLGDGRQAGNSTDGVVARRQIAQILVHSLSSDQALRKTFELIAAAGAAQNDFDALFAPLDVDPQDTLDGVHDMADMALADEPLRMRDDLETVQNRPTKRTH
jgi:hypothetical protein